MNRRTLVEILGGLLGFMVGAIGGGFVGLVVGGTLLGGIDLTKYTCLQGYEFAGFIGVILGILVITPLGVRVALKIEDKR